MKRIDNEIVAALDPDIELGAGPRYSAVVAIIPPLERRMTVVLRQLATERWPTRGVRVAAAALAGQVGRFLEALSHPTRSGLRTAFNATLVELGHDLTKLGTAIERAVGRPVRLKPPPTPVATVPSPTTTAQSGAALVITITGTSPSGEITLDINHHQTRSTRDVALPWTFTDAAYNGGPYGTNEFGQAVVSAQDASDAAAATITCTITEKGHELSADTGTGPHATATCQDFS